MKNLDKIKFDENKRHQAGMSVPVGFFEQFQQQLEAKIDTLEAVKPAPIVEMPRRTYSMATRWAIAACCSLLVGIGIFVTLNNDETNATPSAVNASLANTQTEEEAEMEEIIIRSVNDFELYDYYCEL